MRNIADSLRIINISILALAAIFLSLGLGFAKPSLAKALPGDPTLLEATGTTPVASTHERILYAYTVRPGDTLWDISKWVLRNPFLWPELLRYNAIHNPNLIFPGDVLIVPSPDVLERIKNSQNEAEVEAIRSESTQRAVVYEIRPPTENLPLPPDTALSMPLPREGSLSAAEAIRIPLVEPEGNSLASDLKITGRKNINFNYREYRGGVSPFYFSSGFTRQESLTLAVAGQIANMIKVNGNFYQSDQELENKYDLTLATKHLELFLGDYSARLPETEFMIRDRTLSGGRLTADFENLGGTALAGAAKGQAQYDRFYGNRTQGPYYLKQAPVVYGSEKILLDKQLQVRGEDYTLDYMTGQVTFLRKTVEDITLVEAIYESRQTVFSRSLYAGRVWGKPVSWLRIAGSLVREEDPANSGIISLPGGNTLTPMAAWHFGSDLQAEIPGFGNVSGEWAASRFQANRLEASEESGQAVKATTQGSVGPLGMKAYYRRSSPDFRMSGGLEQGADLFNYGGGLDLKTGGPYTLAGDYDYKNLLLAGARQISEQSLGKAGYRPWEWTTLGYQYYQLRESHDASELSRADHLTRRHSGELDLTREYWRAGLRGHQEQRTGELADRGTATTRSVAVSAASKNIPWLSLNGSLERQIVSAEATSRTAEAVYQVTKAQITGALTPSDHYSLSMDNRWVWDPQYGSNRTIDTKALAKPWDFLNAEGKYTWETLQSMVGSVYRPVDTQTAAGQAEWLPWPGLSLRWMPSVRWTNLASSDDTLNLNRTDWAVGKIALPEGISQEVEVKRDLYWLADATDPGLRAQTEQETRKLGYALHARLAPEVEGNANASYEQYDKNNFNLSLNGYDQLHGRHRSFSLGIRSGLYPGLRLETQYTLDLRDQDGSSPQPVTRTAYPISPTGQITANYDLLNSYGRLRTRLDTGQARLSYQWSEILNTFAEGLYNRNEDVTGEGAVITTASPGVGIAARWQQWRAEATAKWARSWGGAATRQESFATTLAYHPVEMISLAARGQHSRTEDPFSVTTEANLNCSIQF